MKSEMQVLSFYLVRLLCMYTSSPSRAVSYFSQDRCIFHSPRPQWECVPSSIDSSCSKYCITSTLVVTSYENNACSVFASKACSRHKLNSPPHTTHTHTHTLYTYLKQKLSLCFSVEVMRQNSDIDNHPHLTVAYF